MQNGGMKSGLRFSRNSETSFTISFPSKVKFLYRIRGEITVCMAIFEGKAIPSLSYLDLVAAGVFKSVEETVLTPYIGNGTLMSGAIKLAAGYVCKEMAPPGLVRNATSAGFTIDGVEDVIYAFTSGAGFGSIFGSGNNNSSGSSMVVM